MRLIDMKKIILINAIVWAGLLIVNSLLFKDHANWKYMFLILLLGFITINSLLAINHRKKRACRLEKVKK